MRDDQVVALQSWWLAIVDYPQPSREVERSRPYHCFPCALVVGAYVRPLSLAPDFNLQSLGFSVQSASRTVKESAG